MNFKQTLNALFPSIHRFITEQGMLLLISFVSGIFFIGIMFQGVQLYGNFQKIEGLKLQRVKLTKELHYWQDVARQFSNYRDVYFRIAQLQYQLGEPSKSQRSLEKVFGLDPNFKEGRVLGEKIQAN